MAQTEEEYLGYAEEAKNLAVDVPDVSFKDAATFVASATPVIGDALAAKEVYDELQKDDPNYYLAGALGGAAMQGPPAPPNPGAAPEQAGVAVSDTTGAGGGNIGTGTAPTPGEQGFSGT